MCGVVNSSGVHVEFISNQSTLNVLKGGHMEKPQNPKARSYINKIHNTEKRNYAEAYDRWLRHQPTEDPAWAQEPEPPRELSYMAAQAVRMSLSELYNG